MGQHAAGGPPGAAGGEEDGAFWDDAGSARRRATRQGQRDGLSPGYPVRAEPPPPGRDHGHGHGPHGHGHVGGGAPQEGAPRGRLGVLLVVLVAILLGCGAGVVLLWPNGHPLPGARPPSVDATTPVVSAEVVSAAAQQCQGTSLDRLPDGTIPATTTCASIRARVLSGDDQGLLVQVAVPAPVFRTGVWPGDRVNLSEYRAPGGTKADFAWVDFSRGVSMWWLAAGFAVLVVAVARLRGLAAIGGLGLAYATIGWFLLPALRQGENPVAVALVSSVVIMTVILYLAHGFSAKTTAALLGTVFGLGVTAALAAWAVSAAHLNGLSGEDSSNLVALTGLRDLSGVVVAGIIVAGLGVLNDVTITQASAVWELRQHAPHLSARHLFGAAMRIGRDHIASTVYTIAFAYAGASLPVLLLLDIYARPLGQDLSSAQIAEEIARTSIGAIGLVLAMPITTAVAVLTTTRPTTATSPAPQT